MEVTYSLQTSFFKVSFRLPQEGGGRGGGRDTFVVVVVQLGTTAVHTTELSILDVDRHDFLKASTGR
jgi:hypothetical protein